ncbi:hypothetical protein [Endozoicomonas arenosclerae]|nr:hypothetical protein [Endozoicomonas arenosclerae]
MDMKQHNTKDHELETGELILLSLSLGSILAALHFFLSSIF